MADSLLDERAVARALEARPDWTLQGGRLHREVVFLDFAQAFAFMTRVALAAERLDHHPDWSNSWNRVTIDIASHAAGGITERCFALADAVEAALA